MRSGIQRHAAALLVSVIAVTAACTPRPPARFANTFASKEALARAVAGAIAARDARRLESLAISEAEFRESIWPQLPASRPEVGMPVDYVWADTSTKSRGHLARLLSTYGGRRLEIESVAFGRPTTNYGTFRVHGGTRLTVRTIEGEERTVRLLGSMVEAAGGWKVYSYIVD